MRHTGRYAGWAAGAVAGLWSLSASCAPPAADPPPPSAAAPAPTPPPTATPALLDPAGFAIGGLRLGMTPAEVEAALHGREFDSQTIRRPTADGHDTFVAALLLRSKAVRPRVGTRAVQKAGDKPADAAGAASVAPVEQIAVVFSQFAGNRATEILRLHRYGPEELVGDAKLRVALQTTYGLILPPLTGGPDAPDTLTATRAFPQASPVPPAAAMPKIEALATPEGPAAQAADAPPASPAPPRGPAAPPTKLPECVSIADHTGFDMALLASDPGLVAMPLWTGFIPGCGITISVSAHRAASDGSAFDLIFQHIIDQSAALADLEALRAARISAAAAAAKAKQEAAAGHAPSL